MTDGFITVAEAAQRLGVHRNTAYEMAREGRLPGLVVLREWTDVNGREYRTLRVDPKALAKLARKCRRSA